MRDFFKILNDSKDFLRSLKDFLKILKGCLQILKGVLKIFINIPQEFFKIQKRIPLDSDDFIKLVNGFHQNLTTLIRFQRISLRF